MKRLFLFLMIFSSNLGFSQTPDLSELFKEISYYARIQDSFSLSSLEKLAHHSDKRVAEHAINSLGNTKNEKALPILYNLTLDSNFAHRAYTVESITFTNSKNACLYLSGLWNNKSTEEIYEDILKSAGTLFCPNFENIFLEYQKIKNHSLQEVSSNGLIRLGSLKFFDRMIDQLENDSLFEGSMNTLLKMYIYRESRFYQKKDEIQKILSENTVNIFSKQEINTLVRAIQLHFNKNNIEEEVKPENIIHIGKRKNCLFVAVGFSMHGYNLFIYPPKNNFIKGITSWVY